jgi:mRNA-degrading endonuclease RelE of RelBE toxin-antitoxin system
MAFLIRYGPSAQAAIAAMSARDRTIVLSAIREQLSEEPLHETRNRKPMRQSPRIVALGITWELRIAGVWRVFYSVDAEVVTVDVVDIARKGRETTDAVLGSDDDEGEENES